MACRVGEDDIRAIIETDADISVAPFLDAANVFMDAVVDCATDRGVTISADQQRIMEQYLAAHFYAIRDPQYVSKQTERASATFEVGRQGIGIDSTRFGRTAKMLDPSGCLSSFGTSARPTVTWLGKPPSTQTDYVDRD